MVVCTGKHLLSLAEYETKANNALDLVRERIARMKGLLLERKFEVNDTIQYRIKDSIDSMKMTEKRLNVYKLLFTKMGINVIPMIEKIIGHLDLISKHPETYYDIGAMVLPTKKKLEEIVASYNVKNDNDWKNLPLDSIMDVLNDVSYFMMDIDISEIITRLNNGINDECTKFMSERISNSKFVDIAAKNITISSLNSLVFSIISTRMSITKLQEELSSLNCKDLFTLIEQDVDGMTQHFNFMINNSDVFKGKKVKPFRIASENFSKYPKSQRAVILHYIRRR